MYTLFGFRIEVSDMLVGSKKAIRMGGTIYLSPAMFELARDADRLFSAIDLLELVAK